jgi:Tfp pilus assembly protein PilO
MSDLRQTRKQIKTALVVMGVIDLLALVIYISPLVGSTERRRQEIGQLQAELILKTKQVAPLADLPQKVQLANQQIADFYKRRIPEQNVQIYSELGKLTSENGVTIDGIKYKVKEDRGGEEKQDRTANLIPADVEIDLAGNYSALAKFINALERDDMLFIIDSVTLGGEPSGPVKLNMKLEAFLKAAT